LSKEKLNDLVRRSLLPRRNIVHWEACFGQLFPTEGTNQIVLFRRFFEAGFGLPTGAFFHGLLHFYGIEVIHLNPNSILAISIFIHLYEAYLGIPPHFGLWRYLYWLKPQPSKEKMTVEGGA